MTEPPLARVLALCQEALSREAGARDAFLDEACGGDQTLRAAVLTILAEEADTGGRLAAAAWTPAPRLAPGTRLGPYEVESFVGAGGMGEVYKGRDTRLGRTVAIKILPPHVASDDERRARFELEAKTIAGLNHPNVCTLYDVGDQDGSMFLVMEYIEGETLAARLRQGPLPVSDALRIAAQIADAIAAAHGKGISHRDLKPANVMLTCRDAAGEQVVDAKLLDFGLAKLRTGDSPADSPGAVDSGVNDEPRTAPGRMAGTVPYMSPEQLDGRHADARSDIFAFGALLYEMLTGKRAFEGDSAASVITAILDRHPPPPSSLQPLTPPDLDRVVRKCLAKDPDERWQSARDVAAEIRKVGAASGAVARRHRSGRRGWIAAAVVFACCVAVATFVYERTPRTRLQVFDLRPADTLSGSTPHDKVMGRPSGTALAISRDGRRIYFCGAKGGAAQIYVRAANAEQATPVRGTEGGDSPFLSPDGVWLGFRTGPFGEATWRKVPTGGGAPVDIAAGESFGACWTRDGQVLLGGMRGISQVGPDGRTRLATRVDREAGEVAHLLPQVLPDGSLTFTSASANGLAGWRIRVKEAATGRVKTLVDGASDARYVPTGHLVYTRGGALCARPFDLRRLQLSGVEATLQSDVMQALNDPEGISETGASQVAISESGTLVFARGGIFPEGRHVLAWLSRDGTLSPLDTPVRPYVGARLSPDGKRAVTFTMGSLGASSWVYDIERRTTSPLSPGFLAVWPIWAADGASVVFAGLPGTGRRGTMFSMSADRVGPPVPLQDAVTAREWPSSWANGGRELVYVRMTDESPGDIWAMPVGRPDEAYPLVQTPDDELFPAVSPDSRWLAYTSQKPRSGRPKEVYVRPYRSGEALQVSSEGGRAPAWSPDGRKLYWVSTGASGAPLTIYCADVAPGQRLVLGRVEKWYEERGTLSNFALPPPRVRGYDVGGDGRLLIVFRKERPPIESARQIEVVEHWFEELKAKVPASR